MTTVRLTKVIISVLVTFNELPGTTLVKLKTHTYDESKKFECTHLLSGNVIL